MMMMTMTMTMQFTYVTAEVVKETVAVPKKTLQSLKQPNEIPGLA